MIGKWYQKTPLHYTSLGGFRVFKLGRTALGIKSLHYKFAYEHKKRNLGWWIEKHITKTRKCSCGHPYWCHQCYDHGTCIHGVCLAETFLWLPNEISCCCQGFNDMWNKDYPPDKPELRK